MHIDRANKIAMAAKPTDSADPVSLSGLVFMPTDRTPATCSSFRAGEAHDMGSFGFVGEVVDIFPIFPQGHPLVVMASLVALAHAMRIADEERANFVLNTEVDHLSRGFMAAVTDATFSTTALLVLGPLQKWPHSYGYLLIL